MTKLLAIRLKPNEDLKQSLKDFSIQQNIQAGFIFDYFWVSILTIVLNHSTISLAFWFF